MNFDALEGLNDEQKQAVMTTEGYVRVIAGAGSGKTRALTNRYVYLVNDLGISTSNILCVTFTNKAANEMKKRIRSMIGDYDTGFVCTFHGFCVQVLKEDIHTMNYPTNFIVMDTEDTDTILKNVYMAAHVESRSYTFTMAKNMISTRKLRDREHIPYILDMDSDALYDRYLNSAKMDDRIFYGYLYEQKKLYGLDFDDLMTFVFYILTNFEEKLEKWQQRLEYVMVDEFQDVSTLQYKLADLLSGYHRNLFIVGDPDQTIYSWRGAKVEFILDFDKDHEGTKTIVMDRNYRSTPNILNASNSLIRKNEKRMDKDLKAMKDANIPVIYNHAKTVSDEAHWIVKQIHSLQEIGADYKDITILYRSHFVSRSLEEAFIKDKIPYVLYSGVEFYKRKEIKDILCYLRMIVFEDDLSFLRIINEPKRNIGTKRIELLKEYADRKKCSLYQSLKDNLEHELIVKSKAREFVDMITRFQGTYKEMKISDLMMAVMNESGYEAMLRLSGEDERLDNLAELKQSMFDFERSSGEETFLEDYLQNVSLFSNIDQEERKSTVKLMTIHTAKGLEFPYVFVCGLNEGVFPSKHVNSIDTLEEERRLAYVAYTRAENALFLSDSEGVNFDGSFRYPSRFIFNTDKEYVNYLVELEDRLIDESIAYIRINENKIRPAKNGTYVIGDRIIHKVFGIGQIVDVNNALKCYSIKFDSMATNRSISFSIPLERSEDNKG
jgi:DNA helicase-2/ATP-dependent DNA helicase PcrA